jgi:adenine deaminase
MGKKITEDLSRDELKNLLAVARGDKEADLLIKNVKILDLVCGEILDSAIAISGRYIAGVGKEYETQKSKKIYDAKGTTVVPGFIDGHLHVESSMMHPFEFERLTLPLGTTTAICDPHEITNVMGEKGFSWFLRCSELMKQNLFVQVSSCVPALPGFETNGGQFEVEEMKKFRDHPSVMGLAEMMNFPGVINGDDKVLDKIDAFEGMNLDGHCPLLRGKALNAYLAAGIQNCHETITLEEGKEKLQKGMALIIREGSVAKNLKTLTPLVDEYNSSQCFLCTDDRNPYEIFNEGHINYLIKEMINSLNVPPHIAYRLSSFSAAKHFGLKRLGLIAPGKQADIVFLNDVEKVEISDVLIAGKSLKDIDLKQDMSEKLEKSRPPIGNTIKREPVSSADLKLNLSPGLYNVIEIIPEEIITNHLKINYDGTHFEKDDILSISVVERYGQGVSPSLGLVKGTGLKKGAIASSVAHDSHNIIVIGKSPEDMAFAVNTLIKEGGGFCVTEGENVLSCLPLPLAGLLSLQSAEEITEQIKHLKVAFKKNGVVLEEPFLQMAFLALPVIPSLKITDKGLVDVTKFEFVSLQA